MAQTPTIKIDYILGGQRVSIYNMDKPCEVNHVPLGQNVPIPKTLFTVPRFCI